jgi:predicted membrane metal-binding protein
MLRQVYLRPIVPLLIALISGIILGSRFPGHKAGLLVLVFFGAVLTAINIRRNQAAALTPIILFALLGYGSIQPWVSPNLSPNHIQHFSDESRWQVAGVVDSHPVEFKYLKRFVLRADTLSHKKVSYRVTGKIRVTVRGPGAAFAKGDRVVFRSRLREIRNFNNPGGFNYQRYMTFKGIWRTAYTKGSRLEVIQKKGSKDLPQRLYNARRALAALIERAGNGSSAGVLKALIIGDRAAIPSKLRDRFNRAGVGHILAISGLHIGIVATVAVFFFLKIVVLCEAVSLAGMDAQGSCYFFFGSGLHLWPDFRNVALNPAGGYHGHRVSNDVSGRTRARWRQYPGPGCFYHPDRLSAFGFFHLISTFVYGRVVYPLRPVSHPAGPADRRCNNQTRVSFSTAPKIVHVFSGVLFCDLRNPAAGDVLF